MILPIFAKNRPLRFQRQTIPHASSLLGPKAPSGNIVILVAVPGMIEIAVRFSPVGAICPFEIT